MVLGRSIGKVNATHGIIEPRVMKVRDSVGFELGIELCVGSTQASASSSTNSYDSA